MNTITAKQAFTHLNAAVEALDPIEAPECASINDFDWFELAGSQGATVIEAVQAFLDDYGQRTNSPSCWVWLLDGKFLAADYTDNPTAPAEIANIYSNANY